MDKNTFYVSDTHFGHANICKFLNAAGEKIRPWDDVLEMDRELIERWNARVGPKDVVYHLGDIVMNKKHLPTMAYLNGTKHLILGNHDHAPVTEYLQYFKSVRASYRYGSNSEILFTHVPVHDSCIGGTHKLQINIHGHLHDEWIDDWHYINISMEQTGFAPLSGEELIHRIAYQTSNKAVAR